MEVLAGGTQPAEPGRSAWSNCRAGANLARSCAGEHVRHEPISGTECWWRRRSRACTRGGAPFPFCRRVTPQQIADHGRQAVSA